ncbi:transposase [Epibacterium ulvae]|nr:transposase [Epibacterium ulvae]
MIKEQEGGVATAEVCRKHGLSTASFYNYESNAAATVAEYGSADYKMT